jgi:hypothetical protein
VAGLERAFLARDVEQVRIELNEGPLDGGVI